MLFKIIVIVFIIGFIYRALAKFILPVFHITRTATDHMRRMQQQMEDINNKNNAYNNVKSGKDKQKIDEDYIDYEEVK